MAIKAGTRLPPPDLFSADSLFSGSSSNWAAHVYMIG